MTTHKSHESPCEPLEQVRRDVDSIKASNARYMALITLITTLAQGWMTIQVERIRAPQKAEVVPHEQHHLAAKTP